MFIAKAYERTEERQGYRNDTYPHRLTTRVGSPILMVPRLRDGKFSTRRGTFRLIGALLLEIDNKWASGRKYLDIADYYEYVILHQPNPSPKICYL